MTSILEQMGVQSWRLKPALRVNAKNGHPATPENKATTTLNTQKAEDSFEPDLRESKRINDTDLSDSGASSSLMTLDWQGLQALVDGQSHCDSCGIGNSVLGAGDYDANYLFVCDAPASPDVELGQLLSGRAGQLYEAMLLAIGMARESVYTTSVFKCVASGDLNAVPNCDKLLQRQVQLIQPKVIIALGEFAAQSIAKSNEVLTTLREQDLACHHTKVPIVATFSPLQLLDEPLLKAGAWSDLKKCMAIAAQV